MYKKNKSGGEFRLNVLKTKNVENSYGIHSYKHDSNIHRIWKRNFKLYQDDEILIGGNYKTTVLESDGKQWYTKPSKKM